jgi:hypothetical protein
MLILRDAPCADDGVAVRPGVFGAHMVKHDTTAVRGDATAGLLGEAMQLLDSAMLARIVGVPADRLHAWVRGDTAMTFPDRIGSAMAIVTLAPVGSTLFRQAARLRAELAATAGTLSDDTR